MKAVVFHGIGDIRLDNVPEPNIDAYKAFDQRQPGWVKVELLPGAALANV